MKNVLSNLSSLISAKAENLRSNTEAGRALLRETERLAAREELHQLCAELNRAILLRESRNLELNEKRARLVQARKAAELAADAVEFAADAVDEADEIVTKARRALDNFSA